MNKKSKIKKILAFGSLILLLLLFIILTTKNCKTTKAEEVTPNYSTISLYDNNNNLIASKPLEPLINVYNGTYEDLGKTLLIENELINSNQKYTFVIDFNNVGNLRYYTSNFKWICNYKNIAVDYEIQLTFLNSLDNEITKTYIPYEYFNQKSFLIIPDRIFSGTAELSVPVVSLTYSLYPSSNIFYSFIDNTYNGYGEGYARGYDEGYDDGIQYNNNETYMQGYNFGKQDGYNLGYMDGYDEGYDEGYNEGYELNIEETAGTTINFNQLIPNNKRSIEIPANSSGWTSITEITNINAQHKYLLVWTQNKTYNQASRNTPTYQIENNDVYSTRVYYNTGANINLNSGDYYWFITPNASGQMYLSYWLQHNQDATYTNINFFDLTQIYGSGNEPTNIDDFRELFPSTSYPYTTNSLVSVNYTLGYNEGYDDGEYNGIIQGETHQIEQTNFMVELFNALDSFLNIRLLPNITIGLLVFIPLMISLTWFIIKAFRGGGGE